MTKKAAIILAGGQAKRFQVKQKQWEDKALARLFDKPLLINVIERISDAIEEIVVCTNDDARRIQYLEMLHRYSIRNVRVYTDEKLAGIEGPIVGILTGLKFASADYCIVLPCDVPLIQPAVVDYLFNAIGDSCVATPIWPDGRLESLIMVCERPMAVKITGALCELGRRRPDDIIRGVPEVTFVSIIVNLKNLDPEFKSFVNINLPEDLNLFPTRVVENGPIKENLKLNIGCPDASELKLLKTASKHYHGGEFLEAANLFSSLSTHLTKRGLSFWAGIAIENEGKSLFSLSEKQSDTGFKKDYHTKAKAAFMKAAQNYQLEAETYEKNNISFLANHARADGLWCQRIANEERS